jgi:hypothetical protein
MDYVLIGELDVLTSKNQERKFTAIDVHVHQSNVPMARTQLRTRRYVTKHLMDDNIINIHG